MKQLDNYIIEKLKISSSSKINKDDVNFPHITDNELVNKLIYLFQIDHDEKECISAITKWVNKNNVKDIIPVAYPSSITDYSKKLNFPEEVLKLYTKQNSPERCEECEELFDSTYTVFEFNKPFGNGDFTIYGSKKIIGMHNHKINEILYCLVK